LALPALLVASALLVYAELQQVRTVYLRNRAAAIAARLESLPPERFESLAEEEPALLEARILVRGEDTPETAALAPLWDGQELFRTRELEEGGERIFRAYIPLRGEPGARIARIDLAASAADFLVRRASQNLLVAALGGLALLGLSAYALRSLRRAAQLERRRIELEHLAHLGEMSAVLAHEIRNPLGTIKGFAQLAGEKAEPDTRALLEPVLDEVRRLERLVHDLLLYGRTPRPEVRPVEWPALAAELAAYARESIGERPIRFACSGEAWRLRTDPDLLKQALLNLIRNAVEALEGAEEGEIRVSLTAGPRGGAVIAVEDNGPGLPEHIRGKLFEPFHTTKAFGTGLGLSIARKLAASLGGELRLQPAAPHGVRAELALPRAGLEAREGVTWKPS
jgi:two-component system sensor histidine kinase HydH